MNETPYRIILGFVILIVIGLVFFMLGASCFNSGDTIPRITGKLSTSIGIIIILVAIGVGLWDFVRWWHAE